MHKLFYVFPFLLIETAAAQNAEVRLDDTLNLKEVEISSYPLEQSGFQHTSSVEIIHHRELQSQYGESVLFSVNRLPGVRMEERSPASYRFSIRGSLLRSPFGIRNIKFYIDDFPLTDASGNTYFNLLDKNVYRNIEIIKGPEGSYFGANTGGAVMLSSLPETHDSSYGEVNLRYGSYNSIYKEVGGVINEKKYSATATFSVYDSDGYRENSRAQRLDLFTSQKLKYGNDNSISLILFYGKLNYRTPGGLTQSQMENDPRMSRPASGIFHSAVDQKSGIENNSFLTGVSHDSKIKASINNKLLFSFLTTDFNNPFITNYESRKENTFSLRDIIGNNTFNNKISWTAGFEIQQTNAGIDNYGNVYGRRDSIQSSDKIMYRQGFIFAGISIRHNEKLTTEVSASGNLSSVKFNSLLNNSNGEINYDFNFMPRIASIYSFNDNYNLRATISRGYSVPAIAEVHPSAFVISTSLQPEHGWNFETGIRARTSDSRVTLNVSAFYFILDDAIVRRVDENENDYFLNAGGTHQPGAEIAFTADLIPLKTNGFIRYIQLSSSYAYEHFTFSDYRTGENNYSGNMLTGIPEHAVANQIRFDFPKDLNIYFNHYYNSRIPLNDANTFYDDAYNLLEVRLEKTFHFKGASVKIGASVMNLANERYSLGNDLNALGNRFFNPAPERNFSAFLSVTF